MTNERPGALRRLRLGLLGFANAPPDRFDALTETVADPRNDNNTERVRIGVAVKSGYQSHGIGVYGRERLVGYQLVGSVTDLGTRAGAVSCEGEVV